MVCLGTILFDVNLFRYWIFKRAYPYEFVHKQTFESTSRKRISGDVQARRRGQLIDPGPRDPTLV